jgi:hypothetical protein
MRRNKIPDPALLFTDTGNAGTFGRHDAADDRVVTYASCSPLPLPVLVSNVLGDVLVLLDEVRSDLRLPEAASLLWAVPVVQRAYDETSAALERISA